MKRLPLQAGADQRARVTFEGASDEQRSSRAAMKALAITPEEFDAGRHRLPIAGELLLPGAQVCLDADGNAYELKQALLPRGACGTVIELCRKGEGVEVALNAEQQEDGGFFFAALWVLVG